MQSLLETGNTSHAIDDQPEHSPTGLCIQRNEATLECPQASPVYETEGVACCRLYTADLPERTAVHIRKWSSAWRAIADTFTTK